MWRCDDEFCLHPLAPDVFPWATSFSLPGISNKAVHRRVPDREEQSTSTVVKNSWFDFYNVIHCDIDNRCFYMGRNWGF